MSVRHCFELSGKVKYLPIECNGFGSDDEYYIAFEKAINGDYDEELLEILSGRIDDLAIAYNKFFDYYIFFKVLQNLLFEKRTLMMNKVLRILVSHIQSNNVVLNVSLKTDIIIN